jgi:hypothetical protein
MALGHFLFGLSQFHGHGSWHVCEVALIKFHHIHSNVGFLITIINRIKPAYLWGLRVKPNHRGPPSPCTSSGDPNRRQFAHSPNSVAGG